MATQLHRSWKLIQGVHRGWKLTFLVIAALQQSGSRTSGSSVFLPCSLSCLVGAGLAFILEVHIFLSPSPTHLLIQPGWLIVPSFGSWGFLSTWKVISSDVQVYRGNMVRKVLQLERADTSLRKLELCIAQGSIVEQILRLFQRD